MSITHTNRIASAQAPARDEVTPKAGLAQRLNWLRAGVLGANDGIVSVAALVLGVAGATTDSLPILIAGVAGLIGGAISMALGEYVSVSSQSDSERAIIAQQRALLAEDPEAQLRSLAAVYQEKGLSAQTAQQVARELSATAPLNAHLSAKYDINPDDLASAWHAAAASAIAFTLGALLPVLAITLPPEHLRVPLTFVSVLVALGLTGALGAVLGGSDPRRATFRVVVGGGLALAATYLIGGLFAV